MGWKDDLYRLFFPPRCAVCDTVLGRKETGICEDCGKRLPYVAEPTCMRCGKPIAHDLTLYCGDCRRHRHRFDRGFAVFVYTKEMQESIARFKYRDRQEYALFYARELERKRRAAGYEAEMLVPVPVHRRKLSSRGYNQAKLIAEEMERLSGIPSAEAVLRRRDTLPQKELTRRERLSNMAEAFQSNPEIPVQGKRILLVDDIFTTGSTVDLCADVLKRAGASEVSFATVAIGVDR